MPQRRASRRADARAARRDADAVPGSGMYFSGHLIDSYKMHIDHLSASSVAEINAMEDVADKAPVRVAGIVSSVTPKMTRKGDRMVFFNIEDRYGEIECLAFPSQYEKFSYLIRIEAPLYIEGVISSRDGEEDKPKVIANSITELVENSRFESISSTVEIKPNTEEKAVQSLTKVTDLRVCKLVNVLDLGIQGCQGHSELGRQLGLGVALPLEEVFDLCADQSGLLLFLSLQFLNAHSISLTFYHPFKVNNLLYGR